MAVRLPALAPAAMLIAACAPLSEQDAFEQEYRRGEYQAKFVDFREACNARGGTVIVISRHRGPRQHLPVPGDRYHCELGKRRVPFTTLL